MKQVSLVFPGQGSQFVGMGKEFVGTKYFEYFEIANEVLNFKLSDLMFNGPEDELKLTANTQPAILTYSYATFLMVKEKLDDLGLKIDYVLGHSLGEYSALTAAGSFKFSEAVKTVRQRGQFMQEAVPAGAGKMCAVLKISQEEVKELCVKASTETEVVVPANFNSPEQVVISGHGAAVDRFKELCKKGRLVDLPVSAPFHSPLMIPAQNKLKEYLDLMPMYGNKYPYIANSDANIYQIGTDPFTIKQNLVDQLVSGVLWTQSVLKLPNDSYCIEVGPGNVLQGLIRKTNSNLHPISHNKLEELS